MITNNIHTSAHSRFQIILCLHQQERIWGFRINKYVYIATLIFLIPCHRAKQSHRKDTVIFH